MNDRFTIEGRPLLAGFLASLGLGLLWVFVLKALLALDGINMGHVTPATLPAWSKLLYLLVGMGMSVLAGYATAHLARQAKRRHALIQGLLLLVLGIFGLPEARSWGLMGIMNLLDVLLTLPLALWGGSLAIDREQERNAISANESEEGVWPPPPQPPLP